MHFALSPRLPAPRPMLPTNIYNKSAIVYVHKRVSRRDSPTRRHCESDRQSRRDKRVNAVPAYGQPQLFSYQPKHRCHRSFKQSLRREHLHNHSHSFTLDLFLSLFVYLIRCLCTTRRYIYELLSEVNLIKIRDNMEFPVICVSESVCVVPGRSAVHWEYRILALGHAEDGGYSGENSICNLNHGQSSNERKKCRSKNN